MPLENSREIEKIFNQDSYSKKRIGSNAHKRVGTLKGGVHGAIRFSQYKYKKYEKNSKTKSKKIFDHIILNDEFKNYNKDTQKKMMTEWLDRFSKSRIKTEMKVSWETLYKIMGDLGIKQSKKEEGKGLTMRANEEEMREIKDKGTTVKRFNALPDDQKYKVVDYYNQKKGYTNKHISEILGYSYNTFNSKKTAWKKSYEKMQGGHDMSRDEYNDDFLIEGVSDVIKESVPLQNNTEDVDSKNKLNGNTYQTKIISEEVKSEAGFNQLFKIVLDGEHKGAELSKKLDAISLLIETTKTYKVMVIVDEVDDRSN